MTFERQRSYSMRSIVVEPAPVDDCPILSVPQGNDAVGLGRLVPSSICYQILGFVTSVYGDALTSTSGSTSALYAAFLPHRIRLIAPSCGQLTVGDLFSYLATQHEGATQQQLLDELFFSVPFERSEGRSDPDHLRSAETFPDGTRWFVVCFEVGMAFVRSCLVSFDNGSTARRAVGFPSVQRQRSWCFVGFLPFAKVSAARGVLVRSNGDAVERHENGDEVIIDTDNQPTIGDFASLLFLPSSETALDGYVLDDVLSEVGGVEVDVSCIVPRDLSKNSFLHVLQAEVLTKLIVAHVQGEWSVASSSASKSAPCEETVADASCKSEATVNIPLEALIRIIELAGGALVAIEVDEAKARSALHNAFANFFVNENGRFVPRP